MARMRSQYNPRPDADRLAALQREEADRLLKECEPWFSRFRQADQEPDQRGFVIGTQPILVDLPL